VVGAPLAGLADELDDTPTELADVTGTGTAEADASTSGHAATAAAQKAVNSA